MIRAEDYRWYEIRAIGNDGKSNFIERLIATSKEHAMSKMNDSIENLRFAGSKIVAKLYWDKYISHVEASKVPSSVLARYDLNDSHDVELLRTQEEVFGAVIH